MKKLFLIVAVLMLVTPALAVTVSIEAIQGDANDKVEIWYAVTPVPADCEDGNRPRAFGLNVTVTQGNIIDIEDYFVGECNDPCRGYGIFPGTIEISGDTVDNYGTPVAPDDDPGAEGTGIDTNTIIVEMGSLYEDTNCPPDTALLFTITVDLDCDVSISGDPARTGTGSGGKGAVLENLAEVLVNFPTAPFEARGVSRWVPDVVGMYQPDACDAIEANDLVVGVITYECNDTYAYDYVIGQSPVAGTEVKKNSSVDLVKSDGPCPKEDCIAETNPAYDDWVTWGEPNCWCYSRNCRGDADGIKVGEVWVTSGDITILRNAAYKDEATLATVPNGICADFDRIKVGEVRVTSADIGIIRAYAYKAEELVPECGTPPDPNYNAWCVAGGACPP